MRRFEQLSYNEIVNILTSLRVRDITRDDPLKELSKELKSELDLRG